MKTTFVHGKAGFGQRSADFNDRSLALQAAVQGIGIAFRVKHRIRPFVEAKTLIRLLEDGALFSLDFLPTIESMP